MPFDNMYTTIYTYFMDQRHRVRVDGETLDLIRAAVKYLKKSSGLPQNQNSVIKTAIKELLK